MANTVTRGIANVGALAVNGSGFNAGSGAPASGTSGIGAKAHSFGPGSLYMDTATKVIYVNENTQASPYWTPVSYDQSGIRAWHSDFRGHSEKAASNTDATAILAESGLRVHGQGIAETDSGFTVAGVAEAGSLGSLLTTNETAHVAALGVGDTTLPFQPDTHGPIVIDVEFTQNTAITARATFCGFIGAAANALDPVCTGSSTTITLVLDDVAGLFQDSGLTDADGVFAPHNKSNEAASLATTATGVDCSTTISAAGTFQRWRVEISTAGVMTCFVNKTQVTSISASLDADEEVAPSFYVESNASAVKTCDVRRFATWGKRA